MATFPIIPNVPSFSLDFDDDDPLEEEITDDEDEYEDEDEDELPADFNPNILDDLGNTDDENDLDSDEETEAERALAHPPELSQLFNIGKTPISFSTTFPRVQAQPVVPFPVNPPSIKLPVPQQPKIPQIGATIVPPTAPGIIKVTGTPTPTLSLNVVPAPQQLNIPQLVPQQLTVPQLVPQQPNIPQLVPQQPNIPQLMPQQPNIPQLAAQQPNIPQLAAQQPTVPQLAPMKNAKDIDVAAILSKMPNINVTSITPPPAQVPTDINDMIQKESDESDEDFEARRRLTLRLSSIPDYQLNNATAVTAGHIMMKKSKLGLTYDPDVESAVAVLVALLQR